MGAGIAHAFLLAGCRLTLVDAGEQAAHAAGDRVVRMVRRSVERAGTGGSGTSILERLDVTTDLASLGGSELVVEAVPEDPELKMEIISSVERQVDRSAVIATNTSSISVTELSRVLSDPGRFIGLHFFNPVPASQLVEVVVGNQTDPVLVDAARALVDGIGKELIVVRDSPGFATSRLGVLLGLEAVRMLEEGVASADDIDRAMVIGYRHPVGPLRLTDLVGLDVRLGIAEYLRLKLGPRFEPPALLRQKVADGDLGRKSGRGFFNHAPMPDLEATVRHSAGTGIAD